MPTHPSVGEHAHRLVAEGEKWYHIGTVMLEGYFVVVVHADHLQLDVGFSPVVHPELGGEGQLCLSIVDHVAFVVDMNRCSFLHGMCSLLYITCLLSPSPSPAA